MKLSWKSCLLDVRSRHNAKMSMTFNRYLYLSLYRVNTKTLLDFKYL